MWMESTVTKEQRRKISFGFSSSQKLFSDKTPRLAIQLELAYNSYHSPSDGTPLLSRLPLRGALLRHFPILIYFFEKHFFPFSLHRDGMKKRVRVRKKSRGGDGEGVGMELEWGRWESELIIYD